MELTEMGTPKLNEMATVLAKAINQINERGHMDMSYSRCAIGSVHRAAGTWREPGARYERGIGGDVLRVLDSVAREQGAPPHQDHVGGLGSRVSEFRPNGTTRRSSAFSAWRWTRFSWS